MRKRLIALVLVVMTAALSIGLTSAQDPNGQMAGVDKKLDGITLRMATIGNAPYELLIHLS
jgi:hypothetical protein